MEDRFEEKLFEMAAKERMVLPESMDEKVNDILVSLGKNKKHFKMTWKTAVILTAVLVTLMSVTVSASLGLYLERMEAMNEEEMEEYFVQIYSSRLGADNYNRPYTEVESARLDELKASYEEEGQFPKGALEMISSADEYKGRGVAFLGSTSTFFFPDKEMSDEELLQVIDFLHKRDYSLSKINSAIEEGEMTFPSEKIEEKENSLTNSVNTLAENNASESGFIVPYNGTLEIRSMAAGQDCIFLMGWNAIHKMEIGSGDSRLFFDRFDVKTDITALCQTRGGDIYIALLEYTEDEDYNVTVAGEKYRNSIWILSGGGDIKKKIDLSALTGKRGLIKRMAVDEQGNIYIRTTYNNEKLLMVLDKEGNYVKDIAYNIENAVGLNVTAGLGSGKDGKLYTQVETVDQDGYHMGIASVNLEKGCLDEVYIDIVPKNTIMLDIIAAGSDTDLVFWGFDGIFTYNIGDESAVNVLPAYEAPCKWEGALYCALPDGRIVFGECSDYRIEGESASRIPEKVSFYYCH